MTDAGLTQSMRPCLVPVASPLAQLEGGTNMVILEGDEVGQIVLRGAGAGEGPTASAVIGDIMDIARGISIPVFGQPASGLTKVQSVSTSAENQFYIRLNLHDEAGAMGRVSAALGDAGVSIDRMRQEGQEDDAAPVLIVTHPTDRATLNRAIEAIENSGVVLAEPVVLRIENA
jgi:homoserine dehydrogenase